MSKETQTGRHEMMSPMEENPVRLATSWLQPVTLHLICMKDLSLASMEECMQVKRKKTKVVVEYSSTDVLYSGCVLPTRGFCVVIRTYSGAAKPQYLTELCTF